MKILLVQGGRKVTLVEGGGEGVKHIIYFRRLLKLFIELGPDWEVLVCASLSSNMYFFSFTRWRYWAWSISACLRCSQWFRSKVFTHGLSISQWNLLCRCCLCSTFCSGYVEKKLFFLLQVTSRLHAMLGFFWPHSLPGPPICCTSYVLTEFGKNHEHSVNLDPHLSTEGSLVTTRAY